MTRQETSIEKLNAIAQWLSHQDRHVPIREIRKRFSASTETARRAVLMSHNGMTAEQAIEAIPSVKPVTPSAHNWLSRHWNGVER